MGLCKLDLKMYAKKGISNLKLSEAVDKNGAYDVYGASGLIGKIDFSDMVLTVGSASIKYGNFITTIVNFLIISFSIFLVVKYINKLNHPEKLKELNDKFVHSIDKKGRLKKHKKEETPVAPVEPETKVCPYCLTEIKYKATRCPHCTSELTVGVTANESKPATDFDKDDKTAK